MDALESCSDPGVIDSTCLLNALHSVAPGGEVWVPRGRYPGGGLTVPADVTIRMMPGALVSSGSSRPFRVLGGIQAGNYRIFVGESATGGPDVEFRGNRTVEALNARWWGAAGDGVADDTAALQEALTAGERSGLAVVIPPGTYLVGNLQLGDPATAARPGSTTAAPSIVSVSGGGGGRGIYQTILVAKPGTSGFLLQRHNITRADIRDLTIDGAGTAGCVDLSWYRGSAPSAQNVVTDLNLLRCRGIGLDLDNDNDSVVSDNSIGMVADPSSDELAIHMDAESGWASLVDDVAFGGAVWVSVQNMSMTNDMFFGGIELGGQGLNMVAMVGVQVGMDAVTGVALNSTNSGFLGTASVSCVGCWFIGARPGQFMIAGKFALGGRFSSTYFGPGEVFGPITTNQVGYPPRFVLDSSIVSGSAAVNGQMVLIDSNGEGPNGTTGPAGEIAGSVSVVTSATAEDTVLLAGASSLSRCWFSPANDLAAAMRGVYATVAGGSVTLHHPAMAGAVFSVACAPG